MFTHVSRPTHSLRKPVVKVRIVLVGVARPKFYILRPSSLAAIEPANWVPNRASLFAFGGRFRPRRVQFRFLVVSYNDNALHSFVLHFCLETRRQIFRHSLTISSTERILLLTLSGSWPKLMNGILFSKEPQLNFCSRLILTLMPSLDRSTRKREKKGKKVEDSDSPR